jgi:hypothetical protein
VYQEGLIALGKNEMPPTSNMRSAFTRALVESYAPQKAAALIRRFQRNGTWQCPTLVVLHTLWADSAAQYTSEDLRWADRLLAKNAEIYHDDEEAWCETPGGDGLASGHQEWHYPR